jgi:hypothetical protein
VAAEAGVNKTRQQELQAAMRLSKAEAKRLVCGRCHDVSNSPDFEFEAYWPEVAHEAEK